MLHQNNTNRPGPKPGLRKTRYQKPARDSRLQARSLSDFPSLLKPALTVVKLNHPYKHYRLMWQFLGRAFLCKENQVAYGKRHGNGGVTEAGEALAKMLGVRFEG